jgi:hypothetical protein
MNLGESAEGAGMRYNVLRLQKRYAFSTFDQMVEKWRIVGWRPADG